MGDPEDEDVEVAELSDEIDLDAAEAAALAIESKLPTEFSAVEKLFEKKVDTLTDAEVDQIVAFFREYRESLTLKAVAKVKEKRVKEVAEAFDKEGKPKKARKGKGMSAEEFDAFMASLMGDKS